MEIRSVNVALLLCDSDEGLSSKALSYCLIRGVSSRRIPQLLYIICDPDGIRTHDRLLRRQMLYPAELPDQTAEKCFAFLSTLQI